MIRFQSLGFGSISLACAAVYWLSYYLEPVILQTALFRYIGKYKLGGNIEEEKSQRILLLW